jgi:hypothetical protein
MDSTGIEPGPWPLLLCQTIFKKQLTNMNTILVDKIEIFLNNFIHVFIHQSIYSY